MTRGKRHSKAAASDSAPWRRFRGRVADGPSTLLAALRAADDLTEAVWKVLVYAFLRRSEDATNTHAGEMADRAIGLASRADAANSFLGPEIAALSDATIADWIGPGAGSRAVPARTDAD